MKEHNFKPIQKPTLYWNFIDENGNSLCDKDFLFARDFENGFALVKKKNKKYNFVDKNGKFLLKKDVLFAIDFNEDGIATVQIEPNKWNFVNKEGNFLLKNPSTTFSRFSEGMATVRFENGWTYINSNGEKITNEFFERAYDFNFGAAVILKDGKYNYIRKDGTLISKIGFYDACDFSCGVGKIKIKSKDGEFRHNYVNLDGKIISKRSFGYARSFHNGFAIVALTTNKYENKDWNYINPQGEILLKENLEEADDFNDYGFARIINKNDILTFIDKNGQILFEEGFLKIKQWEHRDIIAVKKKNNKWNYFVLTKRKFLLEKDIAYASDFWGEFAKIRIGNEYNFIDKNGQILYKKQNFKKAAHFCENRALVYLDKNKANYIDNNGNLLCEKNYIAGTSFFDGTAMVIKENSAANLIDLNGKEISPIDFASMLPRRKKGFIQIIDNDDNLKFLSLDGKIFSTAEEGINHYRLIEKIKNLI